MTVDDVMDLLVKFSFKSHFTFLVGGFANRKMTSFHQWKNLLVCKIECSQLSVTVKDKIATGNLLLKIYPIKCKEGSYVLSSSAVG